MTQQLFEHLLSLARTPWGPYVLFFHSIGEACLWWIAPDYLLIVLCLSNPDLSFFYTLLATAGSTLGGIFGYAIGRFGGRPLIQRWVKPATLSAIEEKFNKYEVLAIFIAGFTPIPYKFFALAGGAFQIRFWQFVIVTFFARGARFLVSGAVLFFWGDQIQGGIVPFVNRFSWWVGIAVIIFFGLWQWKKQKKKTSL